MAKAKNIDIENQGVNNDAGGISPEELARIKAEVMAEIRLSMQSEAKEETEPAKRKRRTDPTLDEYVEVNLFRDGRHYKDDVYVGINDGNSLIKRGVPAKVKRKYALVLEQSMKQDSDAADYSERKQREFESSTAKFYSI